MIVLIIILVIVLMMLFIWKAFALSTKVPEEFKKIYMGFAWFFIGILVILPIITAVLVGFYFLLTGLL
jgi:hypothetical protein